MADKKSIALFINAVSIFNQDRYKDDAAIKARFENLTEADVAVSAYDLDTETDVFTVTIKSATRAWSGVDQSYKRAGLQNPKIANYTARTLDGVTDQASFLEAIKHIDTAGVYQVAVPELSGATALLVVHAPIPEDTAEGDVETATQLATKEELDKALLYGFDGTTETTTVVGSTYQFADNFLKGAVYHAPVGAAVLNIPATDYGSLDDETYDAGL